jgi:prevent-host-death family protein
MPEQYSIAQAKNKLTAIVHNVETGPAVQLTRHGKPVAMLLSVKEYERLAGKRKDFYEEMMVFRQSLEKDGVEVSGEEFEDVRDETPGREVNL